MTMLNCCLTLLSRTTYNILLRKGNKLQLTALQCMQSDPLRKTSNKKEPQLPAWDGFTFRVSRLSKVTSRAYAAAVPLMSQERPN